MVQAHATTDSDGVSYQIAEEYNMVVTRNRSNSHKQRSRWWWSTLASSTGRWHPPFTDPVDGIGSSALRQPPHTVSNVHMSITCIGAALNVQAAGIGGCRERGAGDFGAARGWK